LIKRKNEFVNSNSQFEVNTINTFNSRGKFVETNDIEAFHERDFENSE